ncbi:MAG: Holliday junction branch migration protein RuvA [Lactobacillus sp.]|jgi:Holliday junction DNA helicase RuvA|nr:Holliday junction branch migration protein RuvA [Lactobacillus sp.]
MIAKLKGIVDTIGEDFCIIDVNGVGYLVSASSKALGRLVKGGEASLLIETVVREDSISLYGFYDAWEKEWFSTLTKVQGVGAKVCLAILSALSPSQLSQAISAQDKSSFQRANGVGPKLAARIVTELKDKIVTVPIVDKLSDAMGSEADTTEDVVIAQASGDAGKLEDVISALVNLGYQRIEAYHAANKAIADAPDAEVGALIRAALKEFVKKD